MPAEVYMTVGIKFTALSTRRRNGALGAAVIRKVVGVEIA